MVFGLVAIAALGFSTAEAARARPASIPPAAARAIATANADWVRAIKAGDAAALSQPYADDGLFIGADGAVLKGRDAVRRMYAARAASGARIVAATLADAGRARSTDRQVYEWGEAHMRVRRADGALTDRSGAFLTVWRRYPDGRWLISRNLVF